MNASAGSKDAKVAAVRAAFEAAKVDAEIQLCEGRDLARVAREAAATGGFDAIVAAGGDGTVSSVAGALTGGETPLAVLPLGTLNHFARDIGMPLELDKAALAIAAQHIERIDIGEVNGHFFINNSSIGLYPEMVVSRDRERKRTGAGKWWAMLKAAWRVLSRFPLMRVRVITQEQSLVISPTPFIFVGNNDYAVDPINLGQRAHLDRGLLSLYMLRTTGRLKMVWLMIRALIQHRDAVDDFESRSVTELRVDLTSRRLKVALDGEVASLVSPLHFQIWPQALRVVRVPSLIPEPTP